MKALIVCVSVSNGNTRKVADRMAEVLDAQVIEPEDVDVETLDDYDLVGFGSGIYFMAIHPRLRRLIRRMPDVADAKAFTFFTSGACEAPVFGFSQPVRHQLEGKGYDVLDSFACRGLDTVGPLKLIGGINKGRPSDRDLDRAAAFATELAARVEHRAHAA